MPGMFAIHISLSDFSHSRSRKIDNHIKRFECLAQKNIRVERYETMTSNIFAARIDLDFVRLFQIPLHLRKSTLFMYDP